MRGAHWDSAPKLLAAIGSSAVLDRESRQRLWEGAQSVWSQAARCT